MRRISATIGLIAAPALIGTIYGMNFQNMPELHMRYGYFFVLSAIIVICLWLYDRFRRAGWL